MPLLPKQHCYQIQLTNHVLIYITQSIGASLEEIKWLEKHLVAYMRPLVLNHEILRYEKKLSLNNMQIKCMFCSHQTNCMPYVSIQMRNKMYETWGSPRVSTGSFTFLLCVNDLHRATKSSEVYHFPKTLMCSISAKIRSNNKNRKDILRPSDFIKCLGMSTLNGKYYCKKDILRARQTSSNNLAC